MSNINIFIITFIELSNFMLLWNILNKNYEKRILKSGLIIIFVSFVVVFTNYYFDSIEFIINYLFLFIMITLCFKKDLKQSLLHFSLILSLFAILQLVTIMILRIISSSYMLKDVFISNLVGNVSCLLLSIAIYKLLPYEKILMQYKQDGYKFYFFLINTLMYIIIAKWIWNFKRQMFLQDIILYLTIPAVFMIGNMFFFVYHVKNSELKKSLEEYRKYSSLISELLEDVRSRQHDFKNHLNTIYGLIHISEEKTLKDTVNQYINSVNMSLENIDKVLQINNKVVTAIIYNKINEAVKLKIQFKYTIQYETVNIPFKDYELSEILNNLLDNAFEVVINTEKEFKKVFLNIGFHEDGCIMEVGNNGRRIELKDIGKIFDKGYTTKTGNGHGYGLYNVKRIVERYNGRIQLSFENNYTIFRIMLT